MLNDRVSAQLPPFVRFGSQLTRRLAILTHRGTLKRSMSSLEWRPPHQATPALGGETILNLQTDGADPSLKEGPAS